MAGVPTRRPREGQETGPTSAPAPVLFEWCLVVGAWLAGSLALVVVSLGEQSWSPYLTLVGVVMTCVVVARLGRLSIASIAIASFPRSWVGASIGVVVGIALIASMMRVPDILRSGYEALTGPTYSLSQADIKPLSVSASVEGIAAAARTIPGEATYSVVGGDKYDVWAVYRFWLAPRAFDPDYHTAGWVVLNGGGLPTDLPRGKRIQLAPGVSVIKVAP